MQDELRCRKHNFIFMFMNLVLNMRCSIFDLSLAFVKLTYGQILFSAVQLQTNAYVSKCEFTRARSPSSVSSTLYLCTIPSCFSISKTPRELSDTSCIETPITQDKKTICQQFRANRLAMDWAGLVGKQPEKLQGHLRAFPLLT